MLFRKKAKLQEPEVYPYGFAVPEQPDTVCSQRILVCLIKGLLIFAAACGTVGGVISSFSLPCYETTLILLLLFFSLVMAFLHYSRFVFNIFYPVIFVGFTYFIFTFRFMVNSGYQAFINILQQSYGDYYALDVYRESTEYFTNRAMTVTYAAGFIGFFLILLLNIFISEYMSPAAVIIMTFPIFQLGIYIEKMPSMIYLVLLLFSYFMVAILRCSRHFLLPYRDKKWTEFKADDKRGIISYRYHASGRIFWQLTLLFFVFTLIIGVICLPMMNGSTNNRLSDTRKKTDEYMSAFTQNGLSSLFDRYKAKGGISGGKLGGVSSVRPDYQTDLVVTFVPYSYEMLYLKAYTGCSYTGHSWEAPSYKNKALIEDLGASYDDYEDFTSHVEGLRLANAKKQDPDRIRSMMRIENLDAEPEYFYLPYYVSDDFTIPHAYDHSVIKPEISTSILTDDLTGILPESDADGSVAGGGSYGFYYYPVAASEIPTVNTFEGTAKTYSDYYTMLNKVYYTDVPESLLEYLQSLHEEIGTADTVDGQIMLIDQYLSQFPYSMTPGTTPMDEDFVRYFLESQKRGYCSHFASAGAMLLRSYGIPARYVEGYAVSLADVTEGSEVDANYDTWFDGKNPLGRTGVVSVNVTDGSAHAWVEVYKDGFGWVPCEFTPHSDEDEQSEAYSGFWDIFSGLFGLAGNTPETVNNQSGTGDNSVSNTANKVNRFLTTSVFRPLIIFLSLLIGISLIYALIRLATDRIGMMLAWKRGDHSKRLLYHYGRVTGRMKKAGMIPAGRKFLLPAEFCSIYSGSNENEASEMMDIMNAALYSRGGISAEEADRLLEFLKICVVNVSKV